ncbi:MAG TPA: hypothetical protein VGF85_09815 [Opitutaceae bacterium]|jgi:hypothetical protein
MNESHDPLRSEIPDLARKGTEPKGRADFCFVIHGSGVQLADVTRRRDRSRRYGMWGYILHSRFLVLISTPVIWLCAIPIAMADIVGSFYQAVCFPIYGIPKVRRSDYLSFDRHHLAYLNFADKFNCAYCAYVNGILAYFTEIAARTEQHWCPIKHAGCVKCVHSRYKRFVEFGDAEKYLEHGETIRRSFGDIDSQDSKTRAS